MARILILEDHSDLAAAWEAALTAGGDQVVLARNYAEFESAFATQRIDLMIVDLSLEEDHSDPKYSGLIALSDNLLRKTLRGQKVPCIVVSGHFTQDEADDPLRQRVMPFQPDRVLAKPFALQELRYEVDKLLDGP